MAGDDGGDGSCPCVQSEFSKFFVTIKNNKNIRMGSRQQVAGNRRQAAGSGQQVMVLVIF